MRRVAHAETYVIVLILSFIVGGFYSVGIIAAHPTMPMWKQMLLSAFSPFLGLVTILALFFTAGVLYFGFETFQNRRQSREKAKASPPPQGEDALNE